MNSVCRHKGPFRLNRIILVVLVLAALVAVRVHFRFAVVIGTSMLPRFQTGDFLLVDQHAYRSSAPQRGDVVLARYGKELIVKRVVAVPGEEVALRRGRLYINGAPFPEKHPIRPGALNISPGRLFPGKFALLGDNREAGMYEGVHAVISQREILGRVVWSIGLHNL